MSVDRKIENQLVMIEARDLVAFDTVSFDGFYKKVRDQYWIENPDISTEASRDKIRSAAANVAKVKRGVERQADSLKSEAQNVIKTINAGKAEALAKMQELQDAIRKPLTDFENADKDRVKAHEDCVSAIEALKTQPVDVMPEQVDLALKTLGDLAQRDWQEFSNRATLAINTTRDDLTALKKRREKDITDAAELDRLRKEQEARERKEREDEIARKAAEAAAQAEQEKAAKAAAEAKEKADREAAEAEQKRLAEVKAREDAERATKEAQERAAKAEADKKAAAEKAEQDRIEREKQAEIDRIARENQARIDKENAEAETKRREEAAAQAERDRQAAEAKRLADETAKREADTAHRKKINNEAKAAIMKAGAILDADERAQAIVVAIASGKIPHVKISY